MSSARPSWAAFRSASDSPSICPRFCFSARVAAARVRTCRVRYRYRYKDIYIEEGVDRGGINRVCSGIGWDISIGQVCRYSEIQEQIGCWWGVIEHEIDWVSGY